MESLLALLGDKSNCEVLSNLVTMLINVMMATGAWRVSFVKGHGHPLDFEHDTLSAER
jgi:hypothetical protein